MTSHFCEYCGQQIPDNAPGCPYCGAGQKRNGTQMTRIPETIEELRAFCEYHKMPLQKMHFYIGEDYHGARAFGIYRKENGDCVVYKNKSDGSRAVRYEGPNEKRAVRELYEKLKSETDLRRAPSKSVKRSSGPSENTASHQKKKTSTPWNTITDTFIFLWKPIVVFFVIMLFALSIIRGPNRGYYSYQGSTYYYQNDSWYLYSLLADTWEILSDVPEELEDHYSNYYNGSSYKDDYAAADFYDSGYYISDYSNSDYDDYDWDSSDYSSWDSSDTDWDSDW